MAPMASVIFLQFGPKKGEPLLPAAALRLIEDLGIEGDHHGRPGSSRQVLLMSEENCDAFGLAPGEVRENIVTRGLGLQDLPAGTRLGIGGAVLEITKDCTPCEFMDSLRPGLRLRILRRRGMLARVIRTGEIRLGDPITVDPRSTPTSGSPPGPEAGGRGVPR